MKKITLLFLFISICVMSYGQRVSVDRGNGDWMIGVGINTVNSTGKWSPFNSPDEWAFKYPLSFSVERAWTDLFSIEQSFSFNKFSVSNIIDSGVLAEEKTFFSTNTKVKYYYDNYLFDADWLDLSVSGGIGIFYIGKLNTSANVGFGATFWLSDDIGIGLKSLGKFAFNQKNESRAVYLSNHFQHHIEVIFKL